MSVIVPATSANLGPGFDAMGLAVSLHAEVGVVGADPVPEGAREAEKNHPAQVAFERAGGSGRVWVKTDIPMGRGLGFSGAVRVGGIVAAELQSDAPNWSKENSRAVHLGTELEGHADNVAPSLWGGVVVATEGTVTRVPVALDAAFVAWVPDFTTSTSESRGRIGQTVALRDAVFNIAHAAMLATAFVSGDPELLGRATSDRIHQEIRFDRSPRSRAALHAGLAAGAWAGWLSGSGPTVMFACARDHASFLASALPAEGHAKVLSLDLEGARVR